MITAEAFRENVLTAVKLGVSSYIVKPFSAQQLKQKIEKVCTAVC
jgi:two-component system chemotaxis response regulator CheY